MSAFKLSVIDHATQVKPWASRAAKERVSLADNPGKSWWGAFEMTEPDQSELVSIGFVWMRSGVARIGGLFTPRDHRGKGAGTMLAEHLMHYAQDNFCSGIDLYSVNPPFWEQYGFVKQGKNGHGVDLMFKAI